jgi:hypothetical protein
VVVPRWYSQRALSSGGLECAILVTWLTRRV